MHHLPLARRGRHASAAAVVAGIADALLAPATGQAAGEPLVVGQAYGADFVTGTPTPGAPVAIAGVQGTGVSSPMLDQTVTADGPAAPSGTIDLTVRGQVVGSADLQDGQATLRLPTSVDRGLHRATAGFVPEGDAFLPSSSRARTVLFW